MVHIAAQFQINSDVEVVLHSAVNAYRVWFSATHRECYCT